MQVINTPMTTFIKQRTSEKFYPLLDKKHLKIRPIYTKSFEDMKNKFCAKTFIILFVKNIFCILVKLEKALKTR